MSDDSENSESTTWQFAISLLEACLTQLQPHAPVQSPAALRQIIPNEAGPHYRFILVELIKYDMTQAAELGVMRPLSEYLQEFSVELPAEVVPADLVLEALQIEHELGLPTRQQDYGQQFPHLLDILQTWSGNTFLGSSRTARTESLTGLIPPHLAIGTKLDDFRILRCVGRGTFASVYLALQEPLQRLVALKVSRRVSNEPQMLSQLDHPNIVRVYDERNVMAPPVRLLYMQFVAGGTLAEALQHLSGLSLREKSGQRLLQAIHTHLQACGLEPDSPAERHSAIAQRDWPSTVAWLGQQLAQGLDYAHRKGVIHRDVKPANVILAGDATPKLVDFNVSSISLPGEPSVTAFLGGSLAYMSPEQLAAVFPCGGVQPQPALDGRSDLFSLGVVLWEMLHGRRPWIATRHPTSWSDAWHLEMAKRTIPIPANHDLSGVADPTVYRVLDRALRDCLQEDRERRPESGQALAKQLQVALHPRAARRLFPELTTRMPTLLNLSPWLVLSCAALLPNLAIAIFNFLYNSRQIMYAYPELWPQFSWLATLVNLTLFPLGIGSGLILIHRYIRDLHDSQQPLGTDKELPRHYGELGHHLALVSGGLWLIAGLVFPLALSQAHHFTWRAALHFFSSQLICGGIALVYPFFLITWLDLRWYYPQKIAESLRDPYFPNWTRQLSRRARCYLVMAASIPLVALGLLIWARDLPRGFLLITIITTAIGFGASFLAVQFMDDTARDLAPCLAD